MRTNMDRFCTLFSVLVLFAILTGMGYLFAHAFISETENRIERTRIHMREMGRGQ